MITGDGELLMGLGALATVGAKQPKNLSIAVLDNERYGETGMQLTHSALGVDLAGLAKACNFDRFEVINKLDVVDSFRKRVQSINSGLRFAQIKIKAESPEKVLPPRDGIFLATRFRANLGFATL